MKDARLCAAASRTTRRNWIAGPLSAFLCLLPVVAGADDHGHGAHVHGVGQLNIALEGGAVEIELISPGANVVGFEHDAKSKADKAAIAAAATALKAGSDLFVFPAAARCTMAAADVDAPGAEHHGHGAHDRHEGENHESSDAHSEFRAHYRFRCERPKSLDHVDVKLFSRMPGARELEARVISARGQRAQTLTPGSTRLSF